MGYSAPLFAQLTNTQMQRLINTIKRCNNCTPQCGCTCSRGYYYDAALPENIDPDVLFAAACAADEEGEMSRDDIQRATFELLQARVPEHVPAVKAALEAIHG